jgi:hypothetical protein
MNKTDLALSINGNDRNHRACAWSLGQFLGQPPMEPWMRGLTRPLRASLLEPSI